MKTIGGESASATTEMTAPWNETTLSTLLSNHKLEDTFNANEFGLFYQCLPFKTYHLSGEKCSGGKNSKVRLTGMAAASAAGEKLEMFVIGKSKKPRCFKNVKQLPCRYRAHKRSWMTRILFEEWVKNLDSSSRAQSRKVALLIDNCPAHREIKNLTNINLIFLSPNTTSVLQPMDQGVIRSLKGHYRKKVVRLCIRAVESNKPLPKIIILQARKHLVSSWNAVSKKTIVNCFKKSNISQSNQQAAVNNDDDPFKSLQEDLEKLHELDNDAIQPNLSAESFADLDSEVVTSASFSNDDDIIAEVTEGENEESEDDQDNEESTPPTSPSTNEVEDALETLQDLSMFSTRRDEIRSLVLNMESLLVRERIDNLKQSVVTDF